MKHSAKPGVLPRLLRRIRPQLGWILVSLVCAAISSIGLLLIPIRCGLAIDAMIGRGEVRFADVERQAAAILAVTLACALAQWVLAVCNNRAAFRVSQSLRDEAIGKLQRLPLSWLDAHPAGDLVSRVIADVDTLADGLLMGFTQLFTGVVTVIGTLVMMLRLSPAVTVAVAVLIPMSLFVAGFIAGKSARWFHAQSAVRGEETAYVNEMIDGQRVVQAFGREERSRETFDEINGRLADASLKATFFSSLVNPTTRLINNLVYAAVAVAGALLALADPLAMSVGSLSAFLTYASQYGKPFNEISGVVTELQNAVACAARIFELLDVPDEEPDAPDALAAFDAKGLVTLRDVSFRYVPDRPLIDGFSLTVEPGRRVAIVGPTGCGKTTLINLLMRFYDADAGEIGVDGVPVRALTRHALRRSWGMVLQETWLRAGTVRENIAFGKPGASEEEIVAAAKAAHVDSFIRRLPRGYDTVISEDGEGISAGQRQLLCIARVMLALPPMLILDEATSSIDTRTEVRIQAAFARMMRGRTSFIVAHRLSTIREADIILVMRDGHIVEQGSHEQLMAADGFYAMLYNSQFAA